MRHALRICLPLLGITGFYLASDMPAVSPAEAATSAECRPQVGNASYYGRAFKGRRTASGERFNPQHLTAAHRSLPLGTTARVTNLETGKSVTVEINDRGPHKRSRSIDLSRAAADRIGLDTDDGLAKVKIEPRLVPVADEEDDLAFSCQDRRVIPSP